MGLKASVGVEELSCSSTCHTNMKTRVWIPRTHLSVGGPTIQPQEVDVGPQNKLDGKTSLQGGQALPARACLSEEGVRPAGGDFQHPSWASVYMRTHAQALSMASAPHIRKKMCLYTHRRITHSHTSQRNGKSKKKANFSLHLISTFPEWPFWFEPEVTPS